MHRDTSVNFVINSTKLEFEKIKFYIEICLCLGLDGYFKDKYYEIYSNNYCFLFDLFGM